MRPLTYTTEDKRQYRRQSSKLLEVLPMRSWVTLDWLGEKLEMRASTVGSRIRDLKASGTHDYATRRIGRLVEYYVISLEDTQMSLFGPEEAIGPSKTV
jgi:predicted ArsR family transcriptional regulator